LFLSNIDVADNLPSIQNAIEVQIFNGISRFSGLQMWLI